MKCHILIVFVDAVNKARDMTSEDDTLIIVTADHGHSFTFGGYHFKGNDILGAANHQK